MPSWFSARAQLLAALMCAGLMIPAAAGAQQTAPPAASASSNDVAMELPPTVDKVTAKKLKAEDNVYLIGHRDVGGGLDFYSQKKEIALGEGLEQEVLKESKVVTDPVVNEYVNRLAQNLVRNSDAKVPFTVHVLQDDEINAFALPGGFFFVNSGVILASTEEDELAGVMAHEIAHVACRHATRNATKADLMQIASIPAIILAGPGLDGMAAEEAASAAVPMQYERFSRGAEQEADWLGMQYLWKAGYDPGGLPRAFESIETDEKVRPGIVSRMFASHPQTADRIALSEKEIATIIPPRPEYIVTTSDFATVQARLRALLKSKIEYGVAIPGANLNAAPPDATNPAGPPVIKH